MTRFGVVACVLGLSMLGGTAALAAEGPVPLSTCSSRYAQNLAQIAVGSQQDWARDWKAFSRNVCGVENWRVPGVRLTGAHPAGAHVVRASMVAHEPTAGREPAEVLRPVALHHAGPRHVRLHHARVHHDRPHDRLRHHRRWRPRRPA